MTASEDNTACVWETASGQVIFYLSGHSDTVLNAMFSPDGMRIVTASHDNTARLWDAATRREIVVMQGHEGRVNCAAFSPDGMRIVTASLDNTARIWEAATGREIAAVRGLGDLLWNASFSPDGRQIVTTSEDNNARLWDVSRTAAIARNSAISLTASLASGIGLRAGSEASDLLMQEAPDDLFAEARRQLLDPQVHSFAEIAERERQLEETIAALRAPLHPNCYLSPTQFAEKFGLASPATVRSNDEPTSAAGADDASKTGVLCDRGAVRGPAKAEIADATTASITARTAVTESDLVGQAFVETVGGIHIFCLTDGRYHVVSHFAVPSLNAARAAAEEMAITQR